MTISTPPLVPLYRVQLDFRTITNTYHNMSVSLFSDQQTSQSASGLQLVWHKYWILSGSEPLGCHCTPLPGWRACLLVSGYNSSSPSPSRLLRQITARFTSWSGTEFPTYTPCTSSLPTLLQRVLKDILKERVPALTQHLANCEWASYSLCVIQAANLQ